MNSFKSAYYKLFNFASDLVAGLTLFRIKSEITFEQKDKKVISLSLYGNDERYIANIDDCIGSYKEIFNDWIIRVYVSNDIGKVVFDKLKNYGCEIITMNCSGVDFRYTFWRFLVFDDSEVERAIIRDIDSVASVREKQMVDKWMGSGKALHVIRDHPHHQSRIMAGMWGLVISNKPYGIKENILSFKKKLNGYGVDQAFLDTVYYKNLGSIYINDIYIRYDGETPVIIPHDEDAFYIGEINSKNGPDDSLRDKVKKLYSDNLSG